MFRIEVIETVYHTATISDEDEKLIKAYIKDNIDDFEFMSDKGKIIEAINILSSDCKIDLYNNTVESESCTDSIKWSEFEECSAEQILKR